MNNSDYQRKVALSLIDRFRREFYEKTGLRAMVHVNNFPKDSMGGMSTGTVISLQQVETIFIGSLPPEIQDTFVLRTRSRKRDLVDLRSMFCSIAYRMNFTYASIGKYIGKDHTSIIHLNRKADALLDTDPRYANMYNNIAEKMTQVYDKSI